MLYTYQNTKGNIFHFSPRSAAAKAQTTWQQNEQRFKSLSENVPGAVYEYIFHKDGSSEFKYLSPVIEKMFGIPVKKFMRSFDHIYPDDKERLMLANKHSQMTNEPFYFEGRLITSDGQVRWHSASSSFSYSTDSGSKVFTGIILDITARKLAEEGILKTENRLRQEMMQAVLEAHERERQEIARELHENISQTLSSCKLILGASTKKQPVSKDTIENIIENIDKVIDELRNISYNLSTSSLQLIGLPQAILDLISRFPKQRKISIYLDANKFKRIKDYDLKVYLTIYRIVQEQLQNISKHSDATIVNIVLKILQGKIFVEISDNGHGFDINKTRWGLGLTNIFNRVEHYNGKIEIDSQPGKGCHLKAYMPVK